ncbi:MAG: hypothetical protein WCL50_03425 [Spirochaetota bacterium]
MQGKGILGNDILPVDVVFHPSWWNRAAGLTFDEDFFYHLAKRVESERRMEEVLYERFGDCGLGGNRGRDLPVLGATHLAAGFIVSEMLGCAVAYAEDSPPQVLPAGLELPSLGVGDITKGAAWKRFEALAEGLKAKHGYLVGDVNWGGILNAALDLRGQDLFLDLGDRPEETRRFFADIAAAIELFTRRVASLSGTTSISVTRNLVNIPAPVFLHSECALTMLSVEDYEESLLGFDADFSASHRPFGIHFCGKDPHRFAPSFAKLPHLDFLDVGWGGDVAAIRRLLPGTFLNLRLDAAHIASTGEAEIHDTIERLVGESGNPWLTGVCCINMDDKVADEKVRTIFRTVSGLRERYLVDQGESA